MTDPKQSVDEINKLTDLRSRTYELLHDLHGYYFSGHHRPVVANETTISHLLADKKEIQKELFGLRDILKRLTSEVTHKSKIQDSGCLSTLM